jgi:hypothetical protein
MTTYNNRRLTRIEQRAQRAGVIPGPEYRKVFVDDPEGVKKYEAENPGAKIFHVRSVIVSPDGGESYYCKNCHSSDCACAWREWESERLPRAERNVRE